jgi:hypothetical protein
MNGKLIIHETRNMINSIKIEISRIFTIIKVSITICYQNSKFRATLKCEISTKINEKRTPGVIENSSRDNYMFL